ncbi:MULTISPECIES: hypothetical protein [Halorussus]|uniref:hypothetical protein n=1 Tax=Halorussus TaxID=1070314 RepID=UPI000E21A756|nr:MULTISPECIES: hypothetical protein [Halorussus]NHN60098.1 hypothetical protein [Halorussus sp. JP-T4]
MPEDESNGDVGAVDTEVLERVARRLRGSSRFDGVVSRPEYALNSVVAEHDTGYFPSGIDRVYLRIRWFETNDFSVHYSEQYGDEKSWECRWDRHLNDHNSRDHFHPPPDAATPGKDENYSNDWRDVLTTVLKELDARIQAFWD